MSNEEMVMHLIDLYEQLVEGCTDLGITDDHFKALEQAVAILEEC